MRVLHVVADHSPASGGVFRAIESMSAGMRERGHDVRVLCTGVPGQGAGMVPRTACPRNFPEKLYASRGFRRELRDHVAEADVVHVHSNWTLPVWWGCREALAAGKPLVHSPHGALSPVSLKYKSWRKRLVAPVDRRALRSAAGILVSSEQEERWVRAWLPEFPGQVVVIPPSIPLPRKTPGEAGAGNAGRKRVLYAGRLHPMKGLDLLVKAWRGVLSAQPEWVREWKLVLVGGSERGYRKKLEALCGKLHVGASVEFCGPLGAEACQQRICDADVVVVPSRSENFGMTVAEAMAAAVPVITTTATPWAGVLNCESAPAGWVVPPSEQALRGALREALSASPAARREMGKQGREVIERNFSLKRGCERLVTMYEEVIRACSDGKPGDTS